MSPTAVILAAHPDDETIGSGALIAGLWDVYVIHVTDGAPRDPRFVPRGAPVGLDAYRATRRKEVIRALSHAGVRADRVLELGGVDQEVSTTMADLTWSLRALMMQLRPAVVISHAYEGGHPDHDAACFIARASLRLLEARGERAFVLAEMTSYHGEGGRFVSGAFVSGTTGPPSTEHCSSAAGAVLRALRSGAMGEQWKLALTREDRNRKGRMLSCFETQVGVLAPFPIDDETFRVAPDYDFAKPPHDGPLYYERLGWPMTGERWRTLALSAEKELGLERP